MVRRLTPPSFVHVFMICRFQLRLPTDDEIPMFPYINAFHSLSTVLLSTQLKTESEAHSTMMLVLIMLC